MIPETHNTSHVILEREREREIGVDNVVTFTVCCLCAKVHCKRFSSSAAAQKREPTMVIFLFLLCVFFDKATQNLNFLRLIYEVGRLKLLGSANII